MSTSTKKTTERKPVSALHKIYAQVHRFFESTRQGEDPYTDQYFDAANDGSADAHADAEARRVSRNRARFAVGNNGWLAGMSRTYKNDLVGTGFRIEVVDEVASESLQREIQKKFHRWLRDVQFARKFRCQVAAKRMDGEGIGIVYPIQSESVRRRFKNPVKLGFRLLDCDRLQDGAMESHGNSGFINGIKYDEYGDPETYRFLKEHPGSDLLTLTVDADPYQYVPAENVIHLYEMNRPEQSRGLTEYGPALLPSSLFAQYSRSVVKAARNAARFFGYISTQLEPVSEEVTDEQGNSTYRQERCEPGEEFTFDDDMFRVLPDAYKAENFKAEHPTATHKDFTRSSVNEMGRPLGMPLNKALGNSDESSYASGRLDHQDYQKGVLVERHDIELLAAEKVFSLWWDAAIRTEGFLSREARQLRGPNDYPVYPEIIIHWDGFPHVDPQKEARAQTERLRNGTSHLMKEWSKEGSVALDEMKASARSLGMTLEQYQSKVATYLFGADPEPVTGQSSTSTQQEMEARIEALEEAADL